MDEVEKNVRYFRCEKSMSLGLKDKLYKIFVRPAMSYGSESWSMYNKLTEQRVNEADTRMLKDRCVE